MKTVLVFDTDDPKGMENTISIVEHLAKEYRERSLEYAHREAFGKIVFIKILRSFMTEGQEVTLEERTSLRFAKKFSDRVWTEKKKL